MITTCEAAIQEVFRGRTDVLTVEEVNREVQKRFPGMWKLGTIYATLYRCSVNDVNQRNPGTRSQGFLFALGNGKFRLSTTTKTGQPILRTDAQKAAEENVSALSSFEPGNRPTNLWGWALDVWNLVKEFQTEFT